MPANQTLNSGKSRLLETPVKELAVSVGTLTVTDLDDNAETIKTDQSRTYDPPKASLTVFATGQSGARFSVFYADDVESVPDPTPPAGSRVRVRRSRPKAAAKRTKPERKSPKPPAAKASKKAAKAKTTSRKR